MERSSRFLHRYKEVEKAINLENNSFVQDAILYMHIVPTPAEGTIGEKTPVDGCPYGITGCTNTNLTSCSVASDATTKPGAPPRFRVPRLRQDLVVLFDMVK